MTCRMTQDQIDREVIKGWWQSATDARVPHQIDFYARILKAWDKAHGRVPQQEAP